MFLTWWNLEECLTQEDHSLKKRTKWNFIKIFMQNSVGVGSLDIKIATLAPVTLAEFSPTPAGGHSGHEPAHLPFVQPHRAGLDETAEFVVAARLRGLWWAARQGPGDVISRSFLGSSLRLALCQVRPGNKKKSKNSAPVFSSRSIKKT